MNPQGGRVASAFGEVIADMHQRLGGAPQTRRVVGEWARRAWQAADEGHVCVETGDADALAALGASPAVGAGAPLALDLGCLYLQRLHRAECELAAAVVGLDRHAPLADDARIDATLDPLFPGAAPDDPQLRAVRMALTRRLALVSGGPGTGKTTTLARLLVAFLRLHPEARVCYAAPTGKAAARLAHSLAIQLPELDPDATLGARLPASGMTVHRLLGTRGDAPARASRREPLPWDLVIVDEASMLDLELARALACAIPPHGRLVLAGDRDQLASVEAGAVFSETCASRLGGVVTLERNYRQRDAAGIVELACAIRRGAPPGEIASAIAAYSRAAVDAARIADDALAAWQPALAAVADGNAAAALAAFDRYRVLAALRGGELGVVALNRAIAARVRMRTGAPAQAQWYPGRLVIVTRNQPDAGLVNGDVGVCLDPEHVCFVAADGLRSVVPVAMPPCEDAFAITVHKSQGSEYDEVAFVPAPAEHPLATRELVYTAITRARRALRVIGDASTIAAAARSRTARDGRLGVRIAGLLDAPA